MMKNIFLPLALMLLANASTSKAKVLAPGRCESIFSHSKPSTQMLSSEQIHDLALLQIEFETSTDLESATRLRRLFTSTIDEVTKGNPNDKTALLRQIAEIRNAVQAGTISGRDTSQKDAEAREREKETRMVHGYRKMPQISAPYQTGADGQFRQIGERMIHSAPYHYPGSMWSTDSRFLFLRTEIDYGSGTVRQSHIIDVKNKSVLKKHPGWGLPSSVDNTFAESFFLFGMKIWDLESGNTLYHIAGQVVGMPGSFSRDYAIMSRPGLVGKPSYSFFHRQTGTVSLGKAFAFDFESKRLMGLRNQHLFLLDVTTGKEIPLPSYLANAEIKIKEDNMIGHKDVLPVTLNGTPSAIILRNLSHPPVKDVGSNLQMVGEKLLLGSTPTNHRIGYYNIDYTRFILFNLSTNTIQSYFGNQSTVSRDGSLLLINDPLGPPKVIDTRNGSELRINFQTDGLIPGSGLLGVLSQSGDQATGAFDPILHARYKWKSGTEVYPIAGGDLWVSADSTQGVMLGHPEAPDVGILPIGDVVSPHQSISKITSQNPVVHLSPDEKHLLTVKNGQYVIYDLEWQD